MSETQSTAAGGQDEAHGVNSPGYGQLAGVRAVFVQRDNAPERLVCEAEILFSGGVLDGMKLAGFSLWRSPEGEIYCTFPSRAFGTGSDRRFFDFLRSVEGNATDSKRVKAWLIDQFKAAPQA